MQWFTKLENILFYDQNAQGKDSKQLIAYYALSLPLGWTTAVYV